MPWLQLFIETEKKRAHNIENALLKAGALSVTLQEYVADGDEENPILEPPLNKVPLWDAIKITGLFDAQCNTTQITKNIETQLNTAVHHRWEQLEDKDWEREWMTNYHPIEVSDNLWICPSWCEPPKPEATNVMLDPGLAFGTGTHPTTFLCMQWLARQSLDQKTVLDYGCGSGILGVTALLLGANQALGIDIDPQALVATKDNVLRNQLAPEQLPVYLPKDYPGTVEADILVANILSGPLVELRDDLISHLAPNGQICLSGILSTQANKVLSAYESLIDFEPTTQKEEWVQLSGKRKKP